MERRTIALTRWAEGKPYVAKRGKTDKESERGPRHVNVGFCLACPGKLIRSPTVGFLDHTNLRLKVGPQRLTLLLP